MSNLHQSVVDQVRARIGTTLKDKWRVDALIGMGGMAAVYSATHRTGSRVAIKMLHPALSMNESATRAGTMLGTPAFMPPEQARGRANEMDATSDVWALGATLFWLASGRVVHEAETPNEQLVAAATLPAAALSRVAPEIPIPL